EEQVVSENSMGIGISLMHLVPSQIRSVRQSALVPSHIAPSPRPALHFFVVSQTIVPSHARKRKSGAAGVTPQSPPAPLTLTVTQTLAIQEPLAHAESAESPGHAAPLA